MFVSVKSGDSVFFFVNRSWQALLSCRSLWRAELKAERGLTGMNECAWKSAGWQWVFTSHTRSEGTLRAREGQEIEAVFDG